MKRVISLSFGVGGLSALQPAASTSNTLARFAAGCAVGGSSAFRFRPPAPPLPASGIGVSPGGACAAAAAAAAAVAAAAAFEAATPSTAAT